MIYRFGEFTLDPLTYDLQCNGEPIPVEPQVFGVLNFLIENRDRVVSREELIDAVWDGRIVSDATLSSRISAARTAVDDTGRDQAIIRTIPRRGFRFVATVATDENVDESKIVAAKTPQTIRYCTTADGVQLAYSFAGEGPPLLKVSNWLNHLEFDWASPIWAPLFHDFTRQRQLQDVYGGRQSYGMWFSPPDVGNEVLVTFVNGDINYGVWFGVLFQQDMNHMVPGIAEGQIFDGNTSTASDERGPVIEPDYLLETDTDTGSDPRKIAYSPLRDGLRNQQGLNDDRIRGA